MCIFRQRMIYKGDMPPLKVSHSSAGILAFNLANSKMENSKEMNFPYVCYGLCWYKTLLLLLLLTSCLIVLTTTRSKMRFVLESSVSWDIKPSTANGGLLRLNRKMSPLVPCGKIKSKSIKSM